MNIAGALLALAGGCIAGIVNSVAGGGSVITYPLLLALGVPPISANMTSSVGVWPGLFSSAYGYRKHIKKLRPSYFWLLVPAGIGGLAGAILLERTTTATFEHVAPWFILCAVLLFALQPVIQGWLYKTRRRAMSRNRHIELVVLVVMGLLVVATYGGFFGPGSGIVLLAAMGFTRLTDIQEINGLKNLLSGATNITANIYFIVKGVIFWQFAVPMIVGNVIGGFIGATLGNRLSKKSLRLGIIGVGIIVAGALFH